MRTEDHTRAVETSAKEVVVSFVKALNDEHFEDAKNYASENIKFIGVLGTRDGSEAYFKDMERMKLKYDVKKIFVDGDDVCLFMISTCQEKSYPVADGIMLTMEKSVGSKLFLIRGPC